MPCMGGPPPGAEDDPTKRVKPFRRSFFSWVASDDSQLQRCEALLLRSIDGRFTQFTAAGLNTIRSKDLDAAKPTVLLLHGFGGGVGCWVQNWDAISAVANVYAIDLPGMARSVREDKDFKATEEVVEYFSGYLEEWLKEVGIAGPITMAGHSFGAYLSAHYASNNPSRVNHLILCDPWGTAVMPPDLPANMSLKHRLLVKFIFNVVSPFGIMRAAGPWGSSLIPRFRPDFADRWEGVIDDVGVFTDYVYHCNAKTPAQGEYAFRACVQGPAYAKVPLAEFIPARLPAEVRLSVLHGERTWMDVGAYRAMVEKVSKLRGGTGAALLMVERAGHQLNTDNADRFNELLVELLSGR
jgi:pimeloyl-ACP methyl ester carboxylesterase